MYCKKHEFLCCDSCIVENHMECRDFDRLADITQNMKFSNAFCDIEQSVAELSHNIHRIQNNREKNLKRLAEMKKHVEEDIKQTRITINKHLDKKQDDIVTKLNATERPKNKKENQLLTCWTC